MTGGKLKDAPRDGTPILMLAKGDVRIVLYGEFEMGYCEVEECDGAFYDVSDMSDFVATIPSNGEVLWMPLTDEQIVAVLNAARESDE